MYAQSIMWGDDELSINNFDEIMDWIIILFLYELCRIIKYRNIENKKKFLKLELVNFFIEIGGLILIAYITQIFGNDILIILVIIYIIIYKILLKKLNSDKKIKFYHRLMILIGIYIIIILMNVLKCL